MNIDIIIKMTFDLPKLMIRTDEFSGFANNSDDKIIIVTDIQEYAKYLLLNTKIINSELLGIFDLDEVNKQKFITTEINDTKTSYTETIDTKHSLFFIEIDKTDVLSEGSKSYNITQRNVIRLYRNLVSGLQDNKKYATLQSLIQSIVKMGENDELKNEQLITQLNTISEAFPRIWELSLDVEKDWRITKSGHIFNIRPVVNVKHREFEIFDNLVRIVHDNISKENQEKFKKIKKGK